LADDSADCCSSLGCAGGIVGTVVAVGVMVVGSTGLGVGASEGVGVVGVGVVVLVVVVVVVVVAGGCVGWEIDSACRVSKSFPRDAATAAANWASSDKSPSLLGVGLSGLGRDGVLSSSEFVTQKLSNHITRSLGSINPSLISNRSPVRESIIDRCGTKSTG